MSLGHAAIHTPNRTRATGIAINKKTPNQIDRLSSRSCSGGCVRGSSFMSADYV